MNKNQKIILAIFIPIIIFFIALIIANSVRYTVKTRTLTEHSVFVDKYKGTPYLDKYKGTPYLDKYKGTTTIYREGNPFDRGRTWYIWVLSLTFCCIFEYKLFGDKKKKDKGDLNE